MEYPRTPNTLMLLGVSAALAAGACDRSPTLMQGDASSSSSPPAGTVHAMKEYAATPPARLGTLPAGFGISVGQPAPDELVEDTDRHAVRLSDLMKRGPILLAFYRGGWCPYCSFEIHELTAAYPDYQKRGVTPVAISVDREEEAAKTNATYHIPFPVLSDPDLHAHQAYRVIHHADDAETAKLKSYGIDIEQASGRQHHSFAVPALFLIDTGGIIRWAHADPDYKTRPRTAQILAAIDATLAR